MRVNILGYARDTMSLDKAIVSGFVYGSHDRMGAERDCEAPNLICERLELMAAEEDQQHDCAEESSPQSEDHTETPNDDLSCDSTPQEPAAAPAFDAQSAFKSLSDRLDQLQAMLDAVGVGSGEVVEPEDQVETAGIDDDQVRPEDFDFDSIINSRKE